EDEGDAVVAREGEPRVSPERVALVDDVDPPARVQLLKTEVQPLVQEEAERLGSDHRPGDSGRDRPDPVAQRPRELLRADLEDARAQSGRALTVRAAGGEHADLGAAPGHRIDQLADVRGAPLRPEQRDAAVGADVGDVRPRHAVATSAGPRASRSRSRATLLRRSNNRSARSRPARPSRPAAPGSRSTLSIASASGAASPGGTR